MRFAFILFFIMGCAARSEIAGQNIDASVEASSTPDTGTDACGALTADLEAKAKLAAACCDKCNSVQCVETLPGLCCPLAVTVATGQAADDYLNALDAFRNAGCPQTCPFGCPAPQRTCDGQGVCEQP